jgi:hypothetical protein
VPLVFRASEAMEHILLGCMLSREVWCRVLSLLGWSALVAQHDVDVFLLVEPVEDVGSTFKKERVQFLDHAC